MKTLLTTILALMLSIGMALAAVNANTASVDELQTITGIGPTIAQRIVDERRNGPYKSLDDIQARVKGVGETSIRKMSAAGLTVSGGSSKPRAEAAPKGAGDTRPGAETRGGRDAPASAGAAAAAPKSGKDAPAAAPKGGKDAPAAKSTAQDAPAPRSATAPAPAGKGTVDAVPAQAARP